MRDRDWRTHQSRIEGDQRDIMVRGQFGDDGAVRSPQNRLAIRQGAPSHLPIHTTIFFLFLGIRNARMFHLMAKTITVPRDFRGWRIKMNKMKSVNYIEMANDNDLYQTGSLGFYEIKKMEDNTFSIFDQVFCARFC